MFISGKRTGLVFIGSLLLSCAGTACPDAHAASGGPKENVRRLIETNNCPGCALSGANLEQINLPGANLEGANLSGAKLRQATLTRANLRNAVLTFAELQGANLADADLRGADLRGVDLTDAYLIGTKLDASALTTPSPQPQPADSTLTQQQKNSSDSMDSEASDGSQGAGLLTRTWETVLGLFASSETRDEEGVVEQPVQREGQVESDQQTAETRGAVAVGESGSGVVVAPDRVENVALVEEALLEIPGTEVEEEIVEERKEAASVASGVPSPVLESPAPERAEKLEPPVVTQSIPQSTMAANPTTADREKDKQRLLETRKCYGCNLSDMDLSGKNLSGADLEGANLTGSRLTRANLKNANMKGAVLVGADLRNADLRGADLYKADLSRADVTGALMEDALLDDAQASGAIGYR